MTKSVSKVFSHVNQERPQEYSNYENYTVEWNPPDSYQLIKRIGRGKYSDVFLSVDVRSNREVVVKVLKPVRKRKIRREVKILENLRGHPNIVTLLDCVKSESGIPSLIFEHVNALEYSKLVQLINIEDIKFYMHELAKALLYCHSNGIMHRDVKPQNVMIDYNRRILKVIDWGLAEFYHHGMAYNVRVASRYYKSPELLIDFQEYDYSLDMWSYGCVLAGLIFKKDPMFQGVDNKDQLVKIVSVLGTHKLKAYLDKFQHKLDEELAELTEGYVTLPFETFVDASNCSLAIPCALNLIGLCLRMDHSERITAEEALNHHFFNSLKSIDQVCSCKNGVA